MSSTLLSSINIGRETLMTHGSAMAAMADNVSNSNTTGFKSGQAQFSDVLARGVGAIGDMMGASAGDGVALEKIRSSLTQGAIEDTGNPYDLAVDGQGFFALARPLADGTASSNVVYSRAGNFQLDKDGNLINADGLLVMGIPTGGDGTTLAPIAVADAQTTPVPTTTATMTGNLNNEAEIVAGLPAQFTSDGQIAAFKPFATSVTMIDSLGAAHEVTLNFFKTGANAWTVQAFADGEDVTGGTAAAAVAVSEQLAVEFGPDGVPTVNPLALNINAAWANGATAGAAAVDLSGFTGFATPSAVSATTQNGVRAGTPTGIEFADNGAVSVVFDNGTRSQIATMALARFQNTTGLERAGNTLFEAPEAAGEVKYAAPRSDGRGAIRQSALENSNVDLAEQFVNVIRVQRTYQAGSQVIKTADEMLTTTLQIA